MLSPTVTEYDDDLFDFNSYITPTEWLEEWYNNGQIRWGRLRSFRPFLIPRRVYGHPNVAVAANLMHHINQIGDGIFIIEDGGIWSYEPPPPYTTIEKEWVGYYCHYIQLQ